MLNVKQKNGFCKSNTGPNDNKIFTKILLLDHSLEHCFKMRSHDRIYSQFMLMRCDAACIRV
jgi:hypothetical protein